MYIKLLFQEKCIDVFRNLNVFPCYNIDPPVSIQIFSVQKIRKYCFHSFFSSVRTTSRLISMTTIGTLAQKLTYIENFESEHVIMCQFLIDIIGTVVSVGIKKKINMSCICRDNCIGILCNV